jgi:heme exporter protein B
MLAALYWIIIFFASMSALSRVFVREEDSGTARMLRLYASPTAVYVGKLLFNLGLLVSLCVLLLPLFAIFMNVVQADWLLLITITLLGAIGLAGATTILAAVVARAGVRGALFAVLSFPVLLPLLALAISATETAFGTGGFGAAANELRLLTAYAVVMITISWALFDFVWNE